MADAALKYVTREEYLALDLVSEEKLEYRDGVILPMAMAGSSLNHARLVHALGRELGNATEGTPCESFGSETKLRIESTESYYFPDAMVACGEIDVESETNGIIRNPVVVFEVLSPGTANRDKDQKFFDYQTVPSVKEIVFLSSERRVAERYERGDDASWRYTAYVGDVRLPIAAAGIELDLAGLYARTSL